jgi:hypothetical protein
MSDPNFVTVLRLCNVCYRSEVGMTVNVDVDLAEIRQVVSEMNPADGHGVLAQPGYTLMSAGNTSC